MAIHRVLGLVALALFAMGAVDVLAAATPTCRRVLPEGGYARELLSLDGWVSAHAQIGRDGARGLFLAGSTYDASCEPALVAAAWARACFGAPTRDRYRTVWRWAPSTT